MLAKVSLVMGMHVPPGSFPWAAEMSPVTISLNEGFLEIEWQKVQAVPVSGFVEAMWGVPGNFHSASLLGLPSACLGFCFEN